MSKKLRKLEIFLELVSIATFSLPIHGRILIAERMHLSTLLSGPHVELKSIDVVKFHYYFVALRLQLGLASILTYFFKCGGKKIVDNF